LPFSSIYWFKRPGISGTPNPIAIGFLSAGADSKELIGAAKVRVKIGLEKRLHQLREILRKPFKYTHLKKAGHPVFGWPHPQKLL